MRFGVVRFPGSCDDVDALQAAHASATRRLLWHADRDLQGVDAVIVPGGFCYGDYLRAGAIARFAPVMDEVVEFAHDGGLVLGICNGFQVLCEAGLLPGALLPNVSLRFICRQVALEVVDRATPFTSACARRALSIPVKHTTGRYYAPDPVRACVLRYASGQNPNGSQDDIAGVCNEGGNVFGLMPHPEHAVDPLTGSADGLKIFESMRAHVGDRRTCLAAPRARAHRPRVRADPRAARPRAQRRRAGDAVADVVRALRVQALAQAAAAAADRRPQSARAGRERRRRRRRRRAGGRVQGRVPQPPERGRAVPGRGDRRRRDPARRVRGRRAPDRGARLAALRRARDLGALPLPARARGRRNRPLRQLDRRADRRRRDLLRVRATSRTASSTRCASGSLRASG